MSKITVDLPLGGTMQSPYIDIVRSSYAARSGPNGPTLRPLTPEGRELALKRAKYNLNLEPQTAEYDIGMVSNCQHADETLQIIGDFYPRDGHGFRSTPRILTIPQLYSSAHTEDNEVIATMHNRLRGVGLSKYYDPLVVLQYEIDKLQAFGRRGWSLIRENFLENNAREALVIVHKITGAAIIHAANPDPKNYSHYFNHWIGKCEGVRLTLREGKVTKVQALPRIPDRDLKKTA